MSLSFSGHINPMYLYLYSFFGIFVKNLNKIHFFGISKNYLCLVSLLFSQHIDQQALYLHLYLYFCLKSFFFSISTNYLCLVVCHYYSADTSTTRPYCMKESQPCQPYTAHYSSSCPYLGPFYPNLGVSDFNNFYIVTRDKYFGSSSRPPLSNLTNNTWLASCSHHRIFKSQPQDDDAQDDDAGKTIVY